MSSIEAHLQAGYTLTARIRDPLSNYAVLATGLAVTESPSGMYRCSTGSLTGLVKVEFLLGAVVFAFGFADLSNPGQNGVSEVVDSLLEITSNASTADVGPNVLTVSVTDSALPVAGIAVSAVSSNNTVAWGRTNNAGVIVFGLQNGTYQLVASSLLGFAPPEPVSVTVPNSSSASITLTRTQITAPSVPGVATVRFVLLDAGQPVTGGKVYAELEDANSTVDTALISRARHTGTTNSSGVADLTMIWKSAFTRGGYYRISAFDATGRRIHERRITVPSQSVVYAEDLPDA